MITLLFIVFVIAFSLCLLKSVGHGQYTSLGTVIKPISPEKLDFIVRWVFGHDPRSLDDDRDFIIWDEVLSENLSKDVPVGEFDMDKVGQESAEKAAVRYGSRRLYWRCVFGLAVTGFAAVSGFVLTVAWVDPVAAGIVAVGGLLKPVGYCIGLAMARRGWVFTDRNFNVLGEFVAGALAYGAMGLATTVGG